MKTNLFSDPDQTEPAFPIILSIKTLHLSALTISLLAHLGVGIGKLVLEEIDLVYSSSPQWRQVFSDGVDQCRSLHCVEITPARASAKAEISEHLSGRVEELKGSLPSHIQVLVSPVGNNSPYVRREG